MNEMEVSKFVESFHAFKMFCYSFLAHSGRFYFIFVQKCQKCLNNGFQSSHFSGLNRPSCFGRDLRENFSASQFRVSKYEYDF